MRCGACRTDNPPGSLFCQSCGHPVAETGGVAGVENLLEGEQRADSSASNSMAGSSRSRGPVVLLAGLAAFAVAGGITAYVATRPSSSAPSAGPPASAPVVTTTATATVEATPAARATTSMPSTPAAYRSETVNLPDPLVLCDRAFDAGPSAPLQYSAADDKYTSCVFAEEVRKAALAQGVTNKAGSVSAYSPVSKRSYVLDCSAPRPMICLGHNDSRIQIYLY